MVAHTMSKQDRISKAKEIRVRFSIISAECGQSSKIRELNVEEVAAKYH